MAAFLVFQDGEITRYQSRRTGRVYTIQPNIAEGTAYDWQAETDGLLILSALRSELVSLIEIADNEGEVSMYKS